MTRSYDTDLRTWTDAHALAMLTGLAAVASGAPGIVCGSLAISSFVVLTYLFRGVWTPRGHYGYANAVTMFRLLLATGLILDAPFTPVGQALVGALVLMLDGWDGWLARRFHLLSRYGETLDKEVDAFFTLVLCVALYDSQRFGIWILIPGTLRYAFVLFIRCAAPPTCREQPSHWSRAIGAAVLSGLTLSLLPLGCWAVAIAGIVTVAVVGSFAVSVWQLYHG